MDSMFLIVINVISAIILVLWFISWIRNKKRIKEEEKIKKSSKSS